MHGRRGVLNLIRHAKCQRKSRHKGLAAGERADLPLFSGDRRINHQIQTFVPAFSRTCDPNHSKRILSTGHFLKTLVGRRKNFGQIESLHVGFQIHATAGDITAHLFIQPVQSFIFGKNMTSCFGAGRKFLQGISVFLQLVALFLQTFRENRKFFLGSAKSLL